MVVDTALGVGLVTRGRIYCIGVTRVMLYRVTRTGADIVIITAVAVAAAGRAGQAAAASTDLILAGACASATSSRERRPWRFQS
jgi:hypothetical protein